MGFSQVPHHFDSKIQFGYHIYSKIFACLTFYLILLKFQQDRFNDLVEILEV